MVTSSPRVGISSSGRPRVRALAPPGEHGLPRRRRARWEQRKKSWIGRRTSNAHAQGGTRNQSGGKVDQDQTRLLPIWGVGEGQRRQKTFRCTEDETVGRQQFACKSALSPACKKSLGSFRDGHHTSQPSTRARRATTRGRLHTEQRTNSERVRYNTQGKTTVTSLDS